MCNKHIKLLLIKQENISSVFELDLAGSSRLMQPNSLVFCYLSQQSLFLTNEALVTKKGGGRQKEQLLQCKSMGHLTIT